MTSEKVRKKVQKVIEEYNYIPNQPVKKIFSKTSNTIAVFIYDMENPFFISLIKELNQICLEHNYMLLICEEAARSLRRNIFTSAWLTAVPASS